MNIVLIGRPGSGKGTQSKRLEARFGLRHLSTGDLMRAAREAGGSLGCEVASFLDSGQLVPDDLVVALVEDEIARESCPAFLFDGFPRTVNQAEALDEMLARRSSRIDCVVELEIDDQIGVERLYERAQQEGRTDDTPETIRTRMGVYEQWTSPVADYYRAAGLHLPVDAVGTMDEVFSRIEQAIGAAAGKAAARIE